MHCLCIGKIDFKQCYGDHCMTPHLHNWFQAVLWRSLHDSTFAQPLPPPPQFLHVLQ
jgi:hypothetical protein